MHEDRDQLIRDRAYRIWERDGRPHGRDAEHWQQAAGEIEAEERALAAQKPAAPVAEEDAPVRSRPVTAPPPGGVPLASEGQAAARRGKPR
jgi:hypothetical protein